MALRKAPFSSTSRLRSLFEVSIKEIRSVPGIEGYRNMESSTDYRKQANRTGWIPSLTAQSSSLLLIDDLTFLRVEAVLCTVRAHMLRYRYEMHTVFAMLTVYSWIRLVKNVLIFLTVLIG